jgi:biotin carboxylase
MKKDKWLIAATAGLWQVHSILEAKKIGLKVLAIDGDLNAEGFKYADRFLHLDINDHDNILRQLKLMKINFLGVSSFASDAGMILAAKIREKFSLPGPNIKVTRNLTQKSLQRLEWSQAKVPSPNFKVFKDKKSALAYFRQAKLPKIIKPIDGAGSRGVTKIERSSDDISLHIDQAFKFSISNQIIIEDYMSGVEFAIEVLIVKKKVYILSITEKLKVEGTNDTVAQELFTSNRSIKINSLIEDTVKKAFLALNYENGPGHAELILMDDDSVGMVEVAGRGGGFMVSDKLVPLASGINYASLICKLAINENVEELFIKKKNIVLRFFPSTQGKITNITGIKEAGSIDGVECGSFVKIGQKITNASTDGDRLGYILSQSHSLEEALSLAKKAEALIKFDIED